MARTDQMDVVDMLSRHEPEILQDWMRVQLADGRRSQSAGSRRAAEPVPRVPIAAAHGGAIGSVRGHPRG